MYRSIQKGEIVRDGAFRRLAKRLKPATIEDLTYVFEADSGGRGPFQDPEHKDQFVLQFPDKAAEWTRTRAIEIGVDKIVPKPILQGRDLIAFGFTPGINFGIIINLAEDLRNDHDLDRNSILEILSKAKNAEEAIRHLRNTYEEQK